MRLVGLVISSKGGDPGDSWICSGSEEGSAATFSAGYQTARCGHHPAEIRGKNASNAGNRLKILGSLRPV
jgi:hypothetical protein